MDVKKEVYRDFETNVNVTIEKVTWRGIALCSEIPPPQLPQPEKQNFQPIVRNRIDNLTATVGELKVFRIPEVGSRILYFILFFSKICNA